MDSKPVIFVLHEHPTKTVVPRWSILDCMLVWGGLTAYDRRSWLFISAASTNLGDNISQHGRRILVPGVARAEALRNHRVVTCEHIT